MGNRVAVLLAGCGHLDGAEVNETVMTLLALRQRGLEPVAFALDEPSSFYADHLLDIQSKAGKDVTSEKVAVLAQTGVHQPRNQLTEAARIVRGHVQNLRQCDPKDYSGIAIPGGFGVALNLCQFGMKGARATVHHEVERVLSHFLEAQKPVLAICIAPALVGLVAAKRKQSIRATLGLANNDASVQFKRMGHDVVECAPGTSIVDAQNFVVSTPAFMWDSTIDAIWPGIQSAAEQFSTWVRNR